MTGSLVFWTSRIGIHTHNEALTVAMASPQHIYEVRPRNDKRGFDLISDALSFGGLWYVGPNAVSHAIGYAKHRSRSHNVPIRVYDEAGNVIDTHEHKGEFKEW